MAATPGSPNPIRVLLVEDEPRLLAMLEALFQGTTGFACLGAHASAETAERQLITRRPDIVLLDLELPQGSGVDWLRTVNARWPELPVVIHTAYDEPPRIFGALEVGAVGYLIKPVPPARLIECVGEAVQGGAPMSPGVARLVLRRFRDQARVRRQLDGLTPREEEILRAISEGFLPEEVAKHLRISPRTVGSHLHHIYRKLHVATRAQAVSKYLERPAV